MSLWIRLCNHTYIHTYILASCGFGHTSSAVGVFPTATIRTTDGPSAYRITDRLQRLEHHQSAIDSP